MPKAKEKDHVHKLKRHNYKTGSKIYFCTLPDCSYKIAPALALGKRCECWRCGNSFILNEYSIRLAKPHCDACHKPKNALIEEVIVTPVIEAATDNSISDLKSRLAHAVHSTDDEGDI